MGWWDIFFLLVEDELGIGMNYIWYIFLRFLLGRHKLAVEAYLQAEAKSDKPDWEIHHNLGKVSTL